MTMSFLNNRLVFLDRQQERELRMQQQCSFNDTKMAWPEPTKDRAVVKGALLGHATYFRTRVTFDDFGSSALPRSKEPLNFLMTSCTCILVVLIRVGVRRRAVDTLH